MDGNLDITRREGSAPASPAPSAFVAELQALVWNENLKYTQLENVALISHVCNPFWHASRKSVCSQHLYAKYYLSTSAWLATAIASSSTTVPESVGWQVR